MEARNSIGVLIPTRNCAALIPGHIESLRSWIDPGDEIVIVDSESRDGTVDLLRAGLSSYRIKVLNHPPGLYQSWNYGIQNVGSQYVYIATVGDSITRDGIAHLLEVAAHFNCDAVISKPRSVDAAGGPMPDSRWPIDEILERLKLREPRVLSAGEQFLFAVTSFWGAILGSSASNLYRTRCLKERPFPTEFGTSGDGGWGILNMFDVKIAATPRVFSTFRHHEKAYARADYYVESLAVKFFRLAQRVVKENKSRSAVVSKILDKARWPELERALETCVVEQDKLERCRGKMPPWFLKPAAWKARAARDRARGEVEEIVTAVLPGLGD